MYKSIVCALAALTASAANLQAKSASEFDMSAFGKKIKLDVDATKDAMDAKCNKFNQSVKDAKHSKDLEHLFDSTQKFADVSGCAAATWEAFEEHLGELYDHENKQAKADKEALAKADEIYDVLQSKLGEKYFADEE